MRPPRASFALASGLAASLSVALSTTPGAAQPAPKIMGSSVGIEAKRFDARVLVENDPGGRVSRVVFQLSPHCPGDPASAKLSSIPEVVAATSTPQGPYRAFSAIVPDPSDGAFGAWILRSTALDAAGSVIGRHQTVITRSFEPRFRALAFAPATLDTSAGPATARLSIDVEHDTPIASLGLITSMHDDPATGYGAQLPHELAADREKGVTPSLTSRLDAKGPTTWEAQFGFPASTPAITLRVTRLFMTDARCRKAELAPPKPLELAVSSKAPRAIPVDVRLEPGSLDRGQIAIGFRLIGPAPRTAPAPEIGGERAPVVTVNLLDTSSPPRLLGSTAARPIPSSPLSERRWDGESMAIVPISLPSGPSALREAVTKGLQIEIDDGGKPLAPRITVRGRIR